MPCGKNETTLSPSQIQLFLAVINQHKTFNDIRLGVNLPVFKVRSALRELQQADYIQIKDDDYYLTEKGRHSLSN
ncbi:winged helix-turn-helix domain-containing protein [Piscibacillus halophilus]|uniref:winged helix-turn-helix domain-containing protein n=1 Tax=Piscibacillus halophilus TaxID=571933 RepID=UPI00158F058D|nr:winged helix-turn-helix domain-containing protein [Piscibacillus halophilus]